MSVARSLRLCKPSAIRPGEATKKPILSLTRESTESTSVQTQFTRPMVLKRCSRLSSVMVLSDLIAVVSGLF